jgi:hypothetical protein
MSINIYLGVALICFQFRIAHLHCMLVRSRSRSHISTDALGVLPLLEQVIRCYIYLSENCFLYFLCRTPSLTRGRVCNLQYNDGSSISSYIATDGPSASSSWCRASNGAHNQILISLFDSYFVFSV